MLCMTLSIMALGIWFYLLLGRGMFWLENVQPWPNTEDGVPLATPPVAIVVPARDEANVIARSIQSLLHQDYKGEYRIFLVDDHSSDGTAQKAEQLAQDAGQHAKLTVLQAPELPAGWGGKVWAMQSGFDAVMTAFPAAQYVLFTDADIVHGEGSLAELVTRAEFGQFASTSFMVKLHCQSFAEKLLIPAFVFFFGMLYPFAYARDPSNRLAAAAGGAMLVRIKALQEIGGFSRMQGALIDDCALAALLKKQGPIWLGLTKMARSIREYPHIRDVWDMIARTAYTQLDYSPVKLWGCMLGMGIVFLFPVFAVFVCGGFFSMLGMIVWFMMVLAFMPMLGFYKLSPAWGLGLPFIAGLYLLATLDSARRFYAGKGGQWKGRVKA